MRLLYHGNPFHEAPRRTVIVLILLPEAVWNFVVSVANEDRLFFTCYELRHSVVPFWGVILDQHSNIALCVWAHTCMSWGSQSPNSLELDGSGVG